MSVLRAGVIAGLIGGALDIIAAVTIYPAVYGAKPERILQSIAAGVEGRAAYEGGAASAILGLVLHFLIAVAAGLVLAFVMARIEAMRRLVLTIGAVFGVAVYFFMQKIVLPLSNAGAQTPDMKAMSIGIAIHIFLFGAPM
ncbi:MAG: hypothetical protein KAH44_10420, partial [Oricola sp.]|nr:hypothetical protein [Oricola sp.]